MLELTDELMTPGCPQCAIKHLSAALFHRALAHAEGEDDKIPPLASAVGLSVAVINLVEVLHGYSSHLWFAVGALERAEECAAMAGGDLPVAREARLILEEHGYLGVKDALARIGAGAVVTHAEWAAAHFGEARRELPAYKDKMRMDDLIGSIERIRTDFFDNGTMEAPAASPEVRRKEVERA